MFGKQKKDNSPAKLVMANGEEKTILEMTDYDLALYSASLEKQFVKGAILGACVLAAGVVVSIIVDKYVPNIV